MLRTVTLECTLQPSGNRTNSVSGPEPPVLLRRFSRPRAHQGLYAAVLATGSNRHSSVLNVLPQHLNRDRTACWRGPELRVMDGALCLARDWYRSPITVPLPADLALLPPAAFREVRLGWHDEQQRHYWQVVVAEPRQTVFGQRVAAVDLGSVYPATLTDGEIGVIFDVSRFTNWQQRAARKTGRLQYGFSDDRLLCAREYRRLQSEEWLPRQVGTAKTYSLERLVSQAVLAWAVEHGVGTLVVGDPDGLTRRDGSLPAPASGLEAESLLTRIMRYLAALAKGLGVLIRFVDEALTSQTCPGCGRRNRAHGRRYKCAACGFHGHRDVVGSSNLLSRYLYGDLGQVWPVETVVYRPAVAVL